MSKIAARVIAAHFLLLALSSCGGEEPSGPLPGSEGTACNSTSAPSGCNTGLVCAETVVGDPRCSPRVFLTGTVFDIESPTTAVVGAQVIAFDEQSAPVTDVFISDSQGNFEVELIVLRNEDGTPTAQKYTLWASAAGYQNFPDGLRQALPIDAASALKTANGFEINNAQTAIGLVALPAGTTRYTIRGEVDAGAESDAVLVVASEQTGGEAYSALTDRSGRFVIFNVPDGTYDVRGYRAELQLTPVVVTVDGAGETGVTLASASEPTATLSGSVNIVNAPGGSQTSVVLAVKSTFDATFGRGESAFGLRAPLSGAPNITGEFTIAGIPDGEYVILAAFENDNLVRDPDTTIGGTATLELTVPDPIQGRTIDLASSFKVTEALAVVSPGADAPEAVTATPTFVWADDSSEDYYTVEVYDALGNRVWETEVERVTGSVNPSVVYAGPPLTTGMIYQFRAFSRVEADKPVRDPSTDPALSMTEDLRGIFFVE